MVTYSCRTCKDDHGPLVYSENDSPERRVWANMLQRCFNPRHPSYKRYGGRGITVCLEWRGTSHAFLVYMGPRPGPEYSIDRIDNDGNYEPGNVRWATREQQIANRGPRRAAESLSE